MNSPGDITPDEVQILFERLSKGGGRHPATISTLMGTLRKSSYEGLLSI